MSTIANIKDTQAAHYYNLDGSPAYEQPKKDGSGMTKTTLAHAKKLNLLPSVTTILRVLDKPALTAWKIEQAVLAVMTTPRVAGEADDAFIKRVLAVDKEQDKERDAAAQLGTDIHAAIEDALNGKEPAAHLKSYVDPVLLAVEKFGQVKASEKCIVGRGYAGRTDAIFNDILVDFKTTKKLPKDSYTEHRLQLAAYAKAENIGRTANIYISTAEPGQLAICVNDDIETTFKAFEHLLNFWQWSSGYVPKQ